MAFARFKTLLRRSKSKNVDYYFDTDDWLDYIAARRTADEVERDELTAASLAQHFGILTKRENSDLAAKLDKEFLLDWYEPHVRYRPHTDPTMSRRDAAERDEDVAFVQLLADSYPAGRELSRNRIDLRLQRLFDEGPGVQEERGEYEAEMEGVWRRMDDVQRAGIDRVNHDRLITRVKLKAMIKRHERSEREKLRAARRERDEHERRLELQQAQAVERERQEQLREQQREREWRSEQGHEGQRSRQERQRPRRMNPGRTLSMYGNNGSQESISSDELSGLVAELEGDVVHEDEWYTDEEYVVCECGCGRRVRDRQDRRTGEGVYGNRSRVQHDQRHGARGQLGDDVLELDAESIVRNPPPPYAAIHHDGLSQHPSNLYTYRDMGSRSPSSPESSSTPQLQARYELEAPSWAGIPGSAGLRDTASQRFELPGDSHYRAARPRVCERAVRQSRQEMRREGVANSTIQGGEGSETRNKDGPRGGGAEAAHFPAGGSCNVLNSLASDSEPYFDYSVCDLARR